MADGGKSSHVPGFIEGDDGVFPDGKGDTSGDYSNWDWQHIMAAITGGGAYTGSDLEQTAAGYSNPQTIQDAANTFWYVQEVLKEVGDYLSGLAEGVTGENGLWKGEAATVFGSAMSKLGQQTLEMAGVLSGGVTGDYNVPQQLANNAHHLYEAIAKIKDIDNWYAKEAARINPDLVMSNGQVRVSANEKIVKMMTDDMRQVLVALAKHYKMNKDSISQPTSPNNPATPGGTPTTTPTDNYSTSGYNGETDNPSGAGNGYAGAGNGYAGAGNGYAGGYQSPQGQGGRHQWRTANHAPAGPPGDRGRRQWRTVNPAPAGESGQQEPTFASDGPNEPRVAGESGQQEPRFASDGPNEPRVAGESGQQEPRFASDGPNEPRVAGESGQQEPRFASDGPNEPRVAGESGQQEPRFASDGPNEPRVAGESGQQEPRFASDGPNEPRVAGESGQQEPRFASDGPNEPRVAGESGQQEPRFASDGPNEPRVVGVSMSGPEQSGVALDRPAEPAVLPGF
ncbi:hypothetical protein [Streptomyces mirabilis]|uniref:hypothetical protein n=1 Tax=Streptomyces mirabilis TaxID=68239 RepID=UPI0022505787|nr:hypothetical protein [Streptomyces mirabilis]MCX4428685.1 hypothetical protein [Streptomyces mirabilis]